MLDEATALVQKTYGRQAVLQISQPWSSTSPWAATVLADGIKPIVQKVGPSMGIALELLTTHCVLMGWR